MENIQEVAQLVEQKIYEEALFLLAPLKSRDAKEMTKEMLGSQKVNLYEKDEENRFARLVLEKYPKWINLETERSSLWEIALACGAEKIIWRILREKQDYQYLTQLVTASDALFEIVLKLKPKKILTEARKEVLLAAIQSEAGKQRLELLKKRGWDREVKNLFEEYKKVLSYKKYKTTRRGQLEKAADQNKLKYLKEVSQ